MKISRGESIRLKLTSRPGGESPGPDFIFRISRCALWVGHLLGYWFDNSSRPVLFGLSNPI
jgi:hypothetical protein